MTPVFWSFRRCPYAIRARLALDVAGIPVEHREIVLRAKPDAFLADIPEGTVPVLVLPNRTLIHSRDIMIWALGQNDPEYWLDMPPAGKALIDEVEGPFKVRLDRYKYGARFGAVDPGAERDVAARTLWTIEAMLAGKDWLFGSPSLADMAVLPFIRQFAHTDMDWFTTQDWPAVRGWLDRFKSSDRFARVMVRHPLWQAAEDAA